MPFCATKGSRPPGFPARNGSTPTTRIAGRKPFAAVALPASNPPPPVGTTIVSRAGRLGSPTDAGAWAAAPPARYRRVAGAGDRGQAQLKKPSIVRDRFGRAPLPLLARGHGHGTGYQPGDVLVQPLRDRAFEVVVARTGAGVPHLPHGVGAVREGMEQPVYYWDPVIAPSGAQFYSGNAAPAWRAAPGWASRARDATPC